MRVVHLSDLAFRDLPGRSTADPLEGLGAASSARIVRLPRTEGRRAHRHPHSEEIVFVMEGEGTVWVEGELLPVGPGDVFRVPIGVPHATIPHRGVEMRLVCFFPHPVLSANTEETEIIVSDQEEGS